METSQSIQPEIERFVDVARRYCAWVEDEPVVPSIEMMRAQRLLAELHLAAIDLPESALEDDVEENNVQADWSIEEWKTACKRFEDLPVYGYWDVFDVLKPEADEPVFMSLADDLADIYGDVKRGLMLFEEGHHASAVWEWRVHFLIHWGAHLTSAQRAIHAYVKDEEI